MAISYMMIPLRPFSGISAIYSNQYGFVFFSGLTSDGTYFKGIQNCFLDILADQWGCTEYSDDYSLDPRRFYGSFLDQDRYYYVFGGIGPYGVYNDMWM
jgi:hypothetical protein